MGDPMMIMSSLFCLCLLLLLFKFLHRFWWTPIRIQYRLRKQGIKGPAYKFIHGNTKEVLEMRNEDLRRGGQPQLDITELELIKEMLNRRDQAFQKAPPPFYNKKIMGNGLATSVGERWFKCRKLISHAFQGECLKKMIPEMIVSAEMMLRSWKRHQGKEIEEFEEFRLLTSDIISRTAFGSSYLEGKNIFDMTKKYSDIIRRNVFKIRLPGIRLARQSKRRSFVPSWAVHHDPEFWGNDAHLFKPERFSEGVAIATNNNVTSYFPFGIGPRTCVGSNFAIVGAKIVLTMILQQYRFVLDCPTTWNSGYPSR
ncbi:putative Cytochrome P450 [Hibiscus syriacus]|uniref:Cytochrome P450 n=1 Tax=Hibiscus syriacus TaxID=106335 RepID=A0A6A2XDG9_HIBSY|nr:putative Cytochrome P450 [Hibiscus syriacus]